MKFIILTLLITFCTSSFIKSTKLDMCDGAQYLRPDIFYVDGQAQQKVTPTKVTILFQISNKAKTASEALQKTADKSHKAIEKVKELSLESLKIQTQNLNIQPYKDQIWDNNNQQWIVRDEGFESKNQLSIETISLDRVGKIIDYVVSAGVNTVNSITYDIDNIAKKALADQLTEIAIKNASKKAQLALNELDMKIVSIKSVFPEEIYQNQLEYTLNVKVGYVIADK